MYALEEEYEEDFDDSVDLSENDDEEPDFEGIDPYEDDDDY